MSRSNAFGALRLLLASLVIFAHAPELLDGDRHREPVTWLFHNGQTAGSLAVDGFFLISGYLISGSWFSAPESYFLKRVLRIYPAFAVCSVLLLLIVGPLGGGSLPHGIEWLRMVYRIALLQAPVSDGAFAALHIPAIDVSMWTIAYEFRCYVLVAVLGALGILSRPRVLVGLTTLLLAFSLLDIPDLPERLAAIVGNPSPDLRLTGVFLTGVCFRQYQLPLRWTWALPAAALLLPLLFSKTTAELGFVLLGGYVLFCVALKAKWKPLLTLNAENDISYGIYLWGWPISALVITFWSEVPLWALLITTLGFSAALGAASWFLVERPAMASRAAVEVMLGRLVLRFRIRPQNG